MLNSKWLEEQKRLTQHAKETWLSLISSSEADVYLQIAIMIVRIRSSCSSRIIYCTVAVCDYVCCPSECVTRVLFLFPFFLHSLHITSLRQQPINETSRSFPENSAYHASVNEQTRGFCPLLSSVCWYRHSSKALTQLFLNFTLPLTPSCCLENLESVSCSSIDLTLCCQFSSLSTLQH